MSWFGIASYGIGALAYAAAGVILLLGIARTRRASVLAGAVTLSGFWAAGITLVLLRGETQLLWAFVGLDALHILVWIVCVLSWLDPPSARRWMLAVAVLAASWLPVALLPGSPFAGLDWTVYLAVVVMTLIGFLAVEQVFRNARDSQRPPLKLLCLAAGGIFAVDLFVYSQAALLNGFEPLFWQVRGLANAALLPLVVLGAKRQSEWERDLFVSRQVVFYTASLLGVGGYLLAMGIVASLIRAFGGRWSFLVELAFLVAAVAVLLVVLFSATIRARFKVFLVKHFYRNKYDYREEWLRLTQYLSRTGDLPVVASNALEGLARTIGAREGHLYLERHPRRYGIAASLGDRHSPTKSYPSDHPLPAFLAATHWVIDAEEYEREPDRYGTAFGHPDERVLPPRTLIVPLDRQGHLQGFVVLEKPPLLRSLNFEDRDLLKTAGKQIAAVLAQAIAQEQLAETRQFEATSRLTAFLMHDLKNIVAQQELVVANAQRFRHRPEFIEDAFATIRASVERMKRLLEQLASSGRSAAQPGRVDVSKVLMEVRSQCADREPIPQIELGSPAWVRMDREQLASVLMHLVRNAQDATPPDGTIKISLTSSGDEVEIAVSDTGCGMDAAFVRDRLFRPFDTTKGSVGMGIGAHQVRHLVRLAGGDVDVTSEPGVGTTFRVRLPLDRGSTTTASSASREADAPEGSDGKPNAALRG